MAIWQKRFCHFPDLIFFNWCIYCTSISFFLLNLRAGSRYIADQRSDSSQYRCVSRTFSLELSDPFHCREKIEYPLLVVKPIEKSVVIIRVSTAAIRSSRGLSYLSTIWNAGRLIFCVRNGYRNYPAAMAAILTY